MFQCSSMALYPFAGGLQDFGWPAASFFPISIILLVHNELGHTAPLSVSPAHWRPFQVRVLRIALYLTKIHILAFLYASPFFALGRRQTPSFRAFLAGPHLYNPLSFPCCHITQDISFMTLITSTFLVCLFIFLIHLLNQKGNLYDYRDLTIHVSHGIHCTKTCGRHWKVLSILNKWSTEWTSLCVVQGWDVPAQALAWVGGNVHAQPYHIRL